MRARWLLERAVVLELGIICAVVLPVVALVFFVVWRIDPRRFRLTAKLPFISIDVEVDGQGKSAELPPGKDEPTKPLPGAEPAELQLGREPAQLPPGGA
jgi:hypothetical protein